MAKEKKLKTGGFSRGLALAKTSLQIGASSARHAVGGIFSRLNAEESDARLQTLLVEQAQILTKQLGELKGSLMKAGQMLSVYGEHFFPPEVNAFLKTLQNEAPPVPYAQMQKVLNRGLGPEKLSELEINPNEIASASIGQVYRARVLSTGEELALKVQYPGVDRAIEGDLRAIRLLFSAANLLPNLDNLDSVFEEVKSMLRQEVDYVHERESILEFQKHLGPDSRFEIASPYERYSSRRVLATRYLHGVSIDSAEVSALTQASRNTLSLAMLELYLNEVFRWGLVQTDPHFGNYKISVAPGREPHWILFDFGATRKLSLATRVAYRKMIRGAFEKNRSLLVEGGIEVGFLRADDPTDYLDLFFETCVLVMEPFWGQVFSWHETDLPQRLFEMGKKLAFQSKLAKLRPPPSELVFLDRKLAGVFTILSQLRAEIDGRALLKGFLEDERI